MDDRFAKAILQIKQIAVEKIPVEKVAHIANALQQKVASDLHVTNTIRQINPQHIISVKDFFHTEKRTCMFIRHGEQMLNEQTKMLQNASLKIRQLQAPYNMDDPITLSSISEAIGTGWILRWLSKTTNKKMIIISSHNNRAREVAWIVAQLADTKPIFDQRLDSIFYPADKSDDEINTILGNENDGQLIWKKEIVNAVCGSGIYEKITKDIKDFLKNGLSQKEILTIYITHTQQLNAADIEVKEQPIRIANLGFRLFGTSLADEQSSLIFKNGFYS